MQTQLDKKIRNDIAYKRERLVRIIVQFRNGTTSAGTGFFISNQGELLTCFHVVSGMELRNLKIVESTENRKEEAGTSVSSNVGSGTVASAGGGNIVNNIITDEHTKLQNFLTHAIMSIQIELMDGTMKMATLLNFDENLDVALLKMNSEKEKEINFFELDTLYTPEYDESTFFCGFQMTGGYSNPTQYPFSINRAVVSAFPEVEVAGGRYQHIQLNSINLGGNSGAPLFAEGSNTVIGIINGNMNWSVNNLSIPLCIAYATSVKLIKEKTKGIL